ncbi:MAG: DUF1127 domain-containing protein [Rhodospirillales bacterium]|jgi:uncharacterized protein YjiS (DUF1127 family)|nr:DUF1127 domain-containing protein [Rhodospirillales bacterium]
MNTTLKESSSPRASEALTFFANFLSGGFIPVMRQWAEVNQQRHDLATLTDYELRDIGITREDAMLEIAKPFWEI